MCGNGREALMVDADIAALELLADDVLDPVIVAEVTKRAVAALTTPTDTSTTRKGMAAELAQLDVEIERLTGAIASGGQLSGLVDALTSRDARRATLREQLAALEAAAQPRVLDAVTIEQQVRDRLAEWKAMLGRQVSWTRQIMTKLLVGKMTLTPITLADGSDGLRTVWKVSV